MKKRRRPVLKGKKYRVMGERSWYTKESWHTRENGFAQEGDVGTVIGFCEAIELCPQPQVCGAANQRTSAFLKLESGIAVVAEKKFLVLEGEKS